MSRSISRRTLVLMGAAALVIPAVACTSATPSITVYKDPECTCCGAWVEHLKAAGFSATVAPQAEMEAINKRFGVPSDLTSCHTGVVNDYAIVGHVPAED